LVSKREKKMAKTIRKSNEEKIERYGYDEKGKIINDRYYPRLVKFLVDNAMATFSMMDYMEEVRDHGYYYDIQVRKYEVEKNLITKMYGAQIDKEMCENYEHFREKQYEVQRQLANA
jgi:hypothetical protein